MAVQIYTAGGNLSSYPGTNMPNTNTALTFMCWLKYSSWATGTTASMVGLYNGTNTASTVPTTAIQLGSRSVGNVDLWTWGGTVLVSTTSGVVLPANDWVHVAYTCTAISGGSQTHSVFVNGTLINSSTNATQIAGVLTQTYINGFPQVSNGTSESNNNLIDAVSLYNRILSPDEIKTAYTLKGMRDGIVNGLINRYTFEEGFSGTASTCIDMGINKNNLTSGGVATLPTYALGFANLNSRAG